MPSAGKEILRRSGTELSEEMSDLDVLQSCDRLKADNIITEDHKQRVMVSTLQIASGDVPRNMPVGQILPVMVFSLLCAEPVFESKTETDDKVYELLTIVRCKPASAFPSFFSSLSDVCQTIVEHSELLG